jgi:hypothetical protein
MKTEIIKIKDGEKLSLELAKKLFGDITKDEQRLEIETRGPWSIISSCKGLTIWKDFTTNEIEIYGYRTLSKPRNSGYDLEGYVSIAGVKRSAFTSSHLFELKNGHLIDVGILFARKNKGE